MDHGCHQLRMYSSLLPLVACCSGKFCLAQLLSHLGAIQQWIVPDECLLDEKELFVPLDLWVDWLGSVSFNMLRHIRLCNQGHAWLVPGERADKLDPGHCFCQGVLGTNKAKV